MATKTRYKSDAFEAIHSAAAAVHRVGAISKATMRDFDEASAKGASMREELANDTLFPKGPVAEKRSWQLGRKLWRSTSNWGGE